LVLILFLFVVSDASATCASTRKMVGGVRCG